VALPLAEVTYWKLSFRQLQRLDDECRSSTTEDLIATLTQATPTSNTGTDELSAASEALMVFVETQKQLKRMCSQALWNLKYFKILEKPFESIADVSGSTPMQRLSVVVPSLAKTLKMVAASSRFYNSKKRLQPLLERISKALAARVRLEHSALGIVDNWIRKVGTDSGPRSQNQEDEKLPSPTVGGEGSDIDADEATAAFNASMKVAESWVTSCRKLQQDGSGSMWADFDWDNILEPVTPIPQRLRDLGLLNATLQRLTQSMPLKIEKAFPDKVAPMPIVELKRQSDQLLLKLDQVCICFAHPARARAPQSLSLNTCACVYVCVFCLFAMCSLVQDLRTSVPSAGSPSIRAIPKLALGSLQAAGGAAGRATISTPRSWAANLGALPLVQERSMLGESFETSSDQQAPLGHFLSAAARNEVAASKQRADNTFNVFSSSPIVQQQWSSLLKNFVTKAEEVMEECDGLIQKSRIDLMMRLQGRGRRKSKSKS